jgi:hypothetical protein
VRSVIVFGKLSSRSVSSDSKSSDQLRSALLVVTSYVLQIVRMG